MKPIQICGGGLAGLTLGILLRQAAVPVRVTEAGQYPRHRVCGEFISGSGQQILQKIDPGNILANAATNRSTAWFARSRLVREADLPIPATGLSRFQLDARLANRFQKIGGELITGKRLRSLPDTEGSVLACGRAGTDRAWIGLKLHCRDLNHKHDLSMHLGTNGYVGVSRIENDRWNVCGLFRLRRDISPGKQKMLTAYLRANDLHFLAESIESSDIDPLSVSATTRLQFGRGKWPPGAISLGDTAAAIPPFAGNGMSIAFESAELAFPELLAYASGEKNWTDTRYNLKKSIRKKFSSRLRAARFLHPFLLQKRLQPTGTAILSMRILPFHFLYNVLR